MVSKIADMKITEVASTTFLALDESILVAEAAKVLYDQNACSIIVTRYEVKSNSRVPVGIITERDIIFRVVAQHKGPFKVTIRDIMSSPIISIDSEATVADALTVLKRSKINRLPVTSKSGALIALVSTEMLAKRLPMDQVKLDGQAS